MIKMFCYSMIFYYWVTSIFTFEMLQLILKFWCRWTPSSTWSLKKQGAFIRYRWDISPVRLTMVEIFSIFVKKFPIFRWVVSAGSSWSHSGHRLHFLFVVQRLYKHGPLHANISVSFYLFINLYKRSFN